MSTTAGELVALVARHLQEDRAFSSGLWTESEVLDYVSAKQRDFLAMTGIVKNLTFVQGVANQTEYSEPTDSIDVERISWNGKKLFPTTQFELDQHNIRWTGTRGRNPRFYQRDNLRLKAFAVSPAPNVAGIGYTQSGAAGTVRNIAGPFVYAATGSGIVRSISGARAYLPGSNPGPRGYNLGGVVRQMAAGSTNFIVTHDVSPPPLTSSADTLIVPDAFARYVMYGALAHAWRKEGEGQDLRRAAYCQSRFDMGVRLAQRLVTGAFSERGR